MIAEKKKVFEVVITSIKEENYEDAINQLQNFLNDDDEEIIAYANYLIGYVNCQWKYEKGNKLEAKRKLQLNINSKFPHPYAFILYSQLIDDANISENYLKKGIQIFPQESILYKELLQISTNKNEVIQEVSQKGFSDKFLLGTVISHLFNNQQWDRISRFIFRIENNNELEDFEKQYLNLINAFVLIFGKRCDYEKAISVFKNIIAEDTDNEFKYAHYMGVIYANIKLGKIQTAVEYFDKLPLTNTLCDFDDGPWPLEINLIFEYIYKEIFEELSNTFLEDKKRKNKAAVLYILYLYSPSEMYDIHRYSKTHATVLSRYLKTEFNSDVATALYNMRCHFNQFKEAYDVFWLFLSAYANPEKKDVFLLEITDDATDMDIIHIANQTVINLKKSDYDTKVFLSQVFPELIEKLHEKKQFQLIKNISEEFTNEQIINSPCTFECAFAYGKLEDSRALELYEGLVQKEPGNSAAINNLGVQYEHKSKLFEALECYKKALTITPTDSIQQRNFERIQELILEQNDKDFSKIRSSVTLKNLNQIGYTIDLCQKIFSIEDKDMRSVILRDLKECAVAIVSGQDKTATIMCGSIIEALLMQKIRESGIVKYDLSEISHSKRASKYPLIDMGLNELLYVAEKENIIIKNSYHLGHYIRDYRNVVHPAKEIRMKEDVSHDNVLTMWSVLKRLIEELL